VPGCREVRLVEVHVVEAGRMLQKVDEANGMLCLPRIFDVDFGRELSDRSVEIDQPVFSELHQPHRDECLADRADAKASVGCDRYSTITIGVADATFPFDACLPDERKAGTRHSRLL
jgi:hypothetical protein